MRPSQIFTDDLLDAVEAHTGAARDEHWRTHVHLRLDKGEEEYGDESERPLAYFLRNRREEAADLVGWAVMELHTLGEALERGEVTPDEAEAYRLEMVGDCAAARHLWRRMTDRLEQLVGLRT